VADRILFIDFEGINLSRTGLLCCGQLMYPGSSTIYILDNVAFSDVYNHTIAATVGSKPLSLKVCFEAEEFRKVPPSASGSGGNRWERVRACLSIPLC
jgi:hypothetical protein